MHIDGARVNIASLSLNDIFAAAYKVKLHQISGPDWMASERFDINAKIPAGSNGDQIPPMLQALLADRFGMAFHRETKDFPVYALVVGKTGLKMKETPPDPPADPAEHKSFDVTTSATATSTSINYGNGMYMTFGNNSFVGRKLPAAAMAETLARFVDRPVVDMTALKGNYDFTLQFSPEDFGAMMMRAAIAAGITSSAGGLMKLIDASNGDSLFNALETLGLKLERSKAPIEVLVIDHIEKALPPKTSFLSCDCKGAVRSTLPFQDSTLCPAQPDGRG